jgi:hypothetical protein
MPETSKRKETWTVVQKQSQRNKQDDQNKANKQKSTWINENLLLSLSASSFIPLHLFPLVWWKALFCSAIRRLGTVWRLRSSNACLHGLSSRQVSCRLSCMLAATRQQLPRRWARSQLLACGPHWRTCGLPLPILFIHTHHTQSTHTNCHPSLTAHKSHPFRHTLCLLISFCRLKSSLLEIYSILFSFLTKKMFSAPPLTFPCNNRIIYLHSIYTLPSYL